MGKAIIIPDLSFSINIGTVNIIESENIDVTSISITDKPTSIINSVQLTASVLPSNATNKAVTWSSSNTSVATVSSSGLVTVVSEGTVTITATSQADNTKYDNVTVTCSLSNIAVTSVTISGSNTALVGDTIQLQVSILPSNATNKGVTWSSSDISIATVSNTGLVTIIAAGTVTITAVSQSDDTKLDDFQIICTSEIPVETIYISGESSGYINDTIQLSTTITPSNATNQAVTWSSSNTSIATVNSTGLVTLLAIGTVTITATSVSDPEINGTKDISIVTQQLYPTDGLILKLNASGKSNSDSDATTWADESGNGNDFTLSGFEMSTIDGWDGNALVFKGDGVGLCRSISTIIQGGFSTNNAITVFCKVTIATNGRRVILDATGAHNGGTVKDNYLVEFNAGWFHITSKETKPTNKCTWSTNDQGVSKLIGVVRQMASTNKMELKNSTYGNTSVTNTFSLLQPSSTARQLQIGLLGNSYGRMDGKIYDIMLYNRELTDNEVSQVVTYLNNK